MDLRLTKFLSSHDYSSLEEYKEAMKKAVNQFYFALPISELDFDQIMTRLNMFLASKTEDLILAGFSVDTQVINLNEIKIDIK